jgi:hypothetical protein
MAMIPSDMPPGVHKGHHPHHPGPVNHPPVHHPGHRGNTLEFIFHEPGTLDILTEGCLSDDTSELEGHQGKGMLDFQGDGYHLAEGIQSAAFQFTADSNGDVYTDVVDIS